MPFRPILPHAAATLLCLIVLPLGVSAQSTLRPRPLAPAVAALRQTVAAAEFRDASLERFFDWVAQTTNTNVHVRWDQLTNVGIDRDRPVSLQVRNVSIAQTLWLVLSDVGGTDVKLAYQAAGNIITISTDADLGQDIIVRTYDVGDLLANVPRFTNAVQIDISQVTGGAAGGGSGLRSDAADTGEPVESLTAEGDGPITVFARPGTRELIALIMSAIDPDSWERGGGIGTISAYRNLLVVRNTRKVHQLIGGYADE